MDAITRKLIHEVSELTSDKRSIRQRVLYDQLKQFIKDFHRFEKLDEVFADFIYSNVYQGTHFPFTAILGCFQQQKRYFRYVHMDIPYLATVMTKHLADHSWLVVKLANDGFVYIEKPGVHMYRHNEADWIKLHTEDCFAYFKKTQSLLSYYYDRVETYYNFECNRLDIKLHPADNEAWYPHLMITYEPGTPHEEHVSGNAEKF